jgi:hypothetical protein
MQDLENRVSSPDEYGILRSAALLRQLLLDARPLVDEVNRERRFKIRFAVSDKEAYVTMVLDAGATFYSTEDGIDPTTAPFGRVVELNRDNFLAYRVMVVDGHTVSVHDLIDQLAHIEGGVHGTEARTEKERALQTASRLFGIGGAPAGVRMTAAIGRVVIRAVDPLRQQILSEV